MVCRFLPYGVYEKNIFHIIYCFANILGNKRVGAIEEASGPWWKKIYKRSWQSPIYINAGNSKNHSFFNELVTCQ